MATSRRPKKVRRLRRGDIHFVSLDPVQGSELAKTRPCLVIQNDVGNQFSATTIVAPLTSQFSEELYPVEVLITPPDGGLSKASVVRTDQLRVVVCTRTVRGQRTAAFIERPVRDLGRKNRGNVGGKYKKETTAESPTEVGPKSRSTQRNTHDNSG